MQRFIDCFECKHFDDSLTSIGWKCEAFPKGIPDEIADGKTLHNKPLPSQNNDIIFEKTKE